MFVLLNFPLLIYAFEGMPTPPLHVEGRYLKDPHGNAVNLHGVAITPSPWFNGCMYGFSSIYCTWDNYDTTGCLNHNKAVMDKLTDTLEGWYPSYIRLHIDPYWTNTPGAPIPENDISRFSYIRLVDAVDKVIVPLIEHAKSRGLYVVLRPPGVCPERIAFGDGYHNYLLTVWGYLSQHPGLKNVGHVMFELANEPVEILGTNGIWGNNSQPHFDALKLFFQTIADTIRSNGANNVLWIPGTGWQSQYKGYAVNPIEGENIGYAVHIYPGFWGGVRNYEAFQSAWDENVKPVADFAPIAVTEIDWSPDGEGTWGVANPLEMIESSSCYNLDGCDRYSHGQWATSLKYNNGRFYLFFNTLDEGNYLLSAADPEGTWEMKKLPGSLYDPGLFFDDDGKTYVVYGIDNLRVVELDENFLTKPGTDQLVYTYTFREGLEGSHLYKINGYYYIYATYGGWWTVLFYDKGAFGRLPNLQPVTWVNNWPEIGAGGKGVTTYQKPDVGEELFNPSIFENGTFDEKTHTLITGTYGFGGWRYFNGIDLSEYKYLVVEFGNDNQDDAFEIQ